MTAREGVRELVGVEHRRLWLGAVPVEVGARAGKPADLVADPGDGREIVGHALVGDGALVDVNLGAADV